MFWAVGAFTGMRLPYLYTEFAFQARAFVLFPLLIGTLAYLALIYRTSKQPETLYMMRMKQFSTKKEKTRATAWALFGLMLIPGTIAWTSIAFPAWAAELFASEPYRHAYQVMEVKARSGPQWSALFELSLEDMSGGEPVTLRLNRRMYDEHRWKRGEMICVKGRASIFGTVIDATSTDIQQCGLSK